MPHPGGIWPVCQLQNVSSLFAKGFAIDEYQHCHSNRTSVFKVSFVYQETWNEKKAAVFTTHALRNRTREWLSFFFFFFLFRALSRDPNHLPRFHENHRAANK